ncbi:MAG: hypothetical protein ABI207_04415 [Crocinitomicaceae bacterium]
MNQKANNRVVESFGITRNGDKIKLDSNLFLITEKISLVITRIDNEFYETIVSGENLSYCKLNLDEKTQNSILEGFAENRKQKLSNQIKEIRNSDNTCDLITGYYIDNSEKPNFCLLQNQKIRHVLNQNFDTNKVKIDDRKTIHILELMYYKINSLHWDYFMSNRYHFKESRTYKEVSFK